MEFPPLHFCPVLRMLLTPTCSFLGQLTPEPDGAEIPPLQGVVSDDIAPHAGLLGVGQHPAQRTAATRDGSFS